MKRVLASVTAVLLGVAFGWRSGVDSGRAPRHHTAAHAVREHDSAPTAEKTRPVDAAKILGAGWYSWTERIGAATTQAELEALFGEMRATEDVRLNMTVGRLLGARWAEVDPMGGVLILAEFRGERPALYSLLTEWFLRDQKAALAGFALLEPQEGEWARAAVLTHLLQRDPGASLRFIRATGKFTPRGNGAEWYELAHTRTDELAALIVEIETARLKSGSSYSAYGLIRIIAKAMAERDPKAALAWADGLGKKMQHDARAAALDTWARQDPEGFIAQLAEWEKSGTKPETVFASGVNLRSAVAVALVKKDIGAAAQWVKKHPWFWTESFTDAIAQRLATGDLSTDEVFDAFAGIDSYQDKVRQAVFGGMWETMTGEEFNAAFSLLQNKPVSGAKTTAMGGLLRKWVEKDPDAAAARATHVPPGAERDALIAEMLRGTDLERRGRFAARAVAALPPGDRAVAVATLFAEAPKSPDELSGNYDPGLFAEMLETAPASPARTKAVERLGLHWGGSDPEAAMSWATMLPGEEALVATAASAHAWADRDAYSLSVYLLDMPAGPARDAATVSLVESVGEAEPDSAWAWTARIDAPEARNAARRAVIESWSVMDADAARAAVDAAELPPRDREALRAVMGP